MSLLERHEEILRVLEFRERMSVGDLADRLAVSEVTIRKDLSSLEDQGHLVRTHGGAVLAQERLAHEPIEARLETHAPAKQAIASVAAQFVKAGETVFLDSGSTCLAVARELAGRDIRVVTNSLEVLNLLSTHPSIVLHATGGSFRSEVKSFIGPASVASIARFNIDRAFVGSSGVSASGVFSAQNTIESETKRAVIEQSARSVIVCDGSKVGHKAFSIFARPDDVQVLVTSVLGMPDEKRSEIEELAASVPYEVVVSEEV